MRVHATQWWGLTVLCLHLLDLVHIGVVLLPFRGRRVVHVSRARHRWLSPATFRYFLNINSLLSTRNKCAQHYTILTSASSNPTHLQRQGIAPFRLVKDSLKEPQRMPVIDMNTLGAWHFAFLWRRGVNFQRMFTSGTADVCKFQHKGRIVDCCANNTFLIVQSLPELLSHVGLLRIIKYTDFIGAQSYFRENKQNGGC